MKTKNNKKLIIVGGLLMVMFALYGVFPLPQGADAADSLKDASDTLSDSDIDATAVTHTFSFVTTTEIENDGYTLVTFHDDFSNVLVGSVTCSNGTETMDSTEIVRCTHDTGLVAADTTLTVTVADNTNPGTDGDRRIDIETYDSSNVLLDRIGVMVYIIEDVLMTATVDPILEFAILGVSVDDAKTVNGINCTATTTATSTPFGTLVVNATTTVCQQLNVTTNADDGFIVTVEQDQEMTSDSGSNINSFDNSATGAGSTTVHTWVSPNNTLDEYHTYGHMGLTSDDEDLLGSGYSDFYNSGGTAQYAGLDGTDVMVVMEHDGPSDGTTQNVGETFVAYSAEIASLQEAGDYESTLTYIVTPTY